MRAADLAGLAAADSIRESFVSPVNLQGLLLENGERLPSLEVAYHTWGRLSPLGDNAVVVCHALTGSSDAADWWKPLFGAGRALDPERDFIVCPNVLGSCYGTTGPTSISQASGRRFGPSFPRITIRDMVRAQAALIAHLGVTRIRMVIGGSMGGMQALEWAAMYPELVETVVPIAASGRHSAWCIGLSEAQRQAIYADPLWNNGNYAPEHPPVGGLAVARMMAMCTYRSRKNFESRFGRNRAGHELFEIESYLQHQGGKLVARFDANAYVALTWAMDSHDLARGRGDYQLALKQLRQPALVVSITSDVLYPPEEQLELAQLMPQAELALLEAPHGHDSFLIEMETLSRLVADFRRLHEERRASAPHAVGITEGRVRDETP